MQLFLDGKVELRPGDCRDVIKAMPDNSIDSVVTDPPYALVSIQKRFGGANAKPTKDGDVYMRSSAGFMSKTWDTGETAFATEFWAEVYRVLKPGGHVVAFSGTRTYHRMTVAIEDAGFEIRDQLAWLYGSGFPKSHDVSKGIDKKRDDKADIMRVTTFMADAAETAGISRADVDQHMGTSDMGGWWLSRLQHRCACPTMEQYEKLKEFLALSDEMDEEVARLNGRKGEHGEAWKVAPVIGTGKSAIANSAEKGRHTVGASRAVEFDLKAANSDAARQWQGWGTALKPAWEPICLARKPLIGTVAENVLEHGTGALNVDGCRVGEREARELNRNTSIGFGGSDAQGTVMDGGKGRWPANIVHDGSDEVLEAFPHTKSGLLQTHHKMAESENGSMSGKNYARSPNQDSFGDSSSAARFFYTAKADKLDRIGSKHPTVKPVDLMQWLCRMVTPPGGIVLDPFAGSGSTGEAAWREGFRAILIEREEEYQADIAARLNLADKGPATRKARAIKQAANDNLPLFKGAA